MYVRSQSDRAAWHIGHRSTAAQTKQVDTTNTNQTLHSTRVITQHLLSDRSIEYGISHGAHFGDTHRDGHTASSPHRHSQGGTGAHQKWQAHCHAQALDRGSCVHSSLDSLHLHAIREIVGIVTCHSLAAVDRPGWSLQLRRQRELRRQRGRRGRHVGDRRSWPALALAAAAARPD